MAGFFEEIKQRRVIPAVGVYVGACWVLVEIMDRLTERYLLSPHLSDMLFWGLYSLVPAVFLIAWTHGRPGKDRVTRAEQVGVSVNVLATAGLLLALFAGKDLSATADVVTFENELGEAETRVVARESHRTRIALFFFNGAEPDSELGWYRYAVTELITGDLDQSPYILATAPWTNWSNGFYARMRGAGFEDGLDVPRSLMQRISADANRQLFVEGDISSDATGIFLTARIWKTEGMEQVAEVSAQGYDLVTAAGRLADEIREALDVPRASAAVTGNVPLGETYGESEEALRAYIASLNRRLFDNDLAGARESLERAIEADPGFAMAWMQKGQNLIVAADIEAAREALAEAQRLDFRLPPRDRAWVKATRYRLAGEIDKLVAFLELQTELTPDPAWQKALADMQMQTGDFEGAKRNYEAALARDALDVGLFVELSRLEAATGNLDAAIDYARRYQEARPREAPAHIQLGDLLFIRGDLAAAQARYEQANLLEDPPVISATRLADIAARRGKVDRARSLIDGAYDVSQTPLQRLTVDQVATVLELRLGRPLAAIDRLRSSLRSYRETQAPLTLALAVYGPLVAAEVYAHDTQAAQETLAEAKVLLQPPLDGLLGFAEASILIAEEDFDGAAAAVDRAEAVLERLGLGMLGFQAASTRAEIEYRRGNAAASIAHYEQAVAQVEGSALGYDLQQILPTVYAGFAESLIDGGQPARAESLIDEGLVMDPFNPSLWLARARLQVQRGDYVMADASLGFVRASWHDADEAFIELARLRRVEAALEAGQASAG